MNELANLRPVHPDLTPRLSAVIEGRKGGNLPGAGDLSDALLEDAVQLGASDIHVEPHREGARVRLRLDGAVRDSYHLNNELGKVLVNQFKALANLDPIVRFTPRDAHARYMSISGPIDLRLGLAPALDRDALSVRLLDPNRLQRSILELGLRKESYHLLSEWLEDTNGMFITSGPTGSGKTTTLYALLHRLKSTNKVIISLEDPVEYQVDGISQIQIDSLHNFEFADGIKAVLRHDPDYLMIGEIRDAASAHTAVRAAIAGRVLLTTMHSRDCVGAIAALRNWGLLSHEIGESLSVVVTQRLVRKLCMDCCERRLPNRVEAEWFHSVGLECPSHVWESCGCERCRHVGFKGRVGVFELWRLDEDDYQMILRNADEHRLRAWLHERGHRFLISEALSLLEQGVTTFGEVKRVAAGTISVAPAATLRGTSKIRVSEGELEEVI